MIKSERQMPSEEEYSSCFPWDGTSGSCCPSSQGVGTFRVVSIQVGTASCSPRGCSPVGQTLNSLHLGGQSLFLHILGFGEDLLAHPASLPAGCPGSCGCPLGWVPCPCVLRRFRVAMCLCLTAGFSLPDPGTVSHSCGTADEPALAAQGKSQLQGEQDLGNAGA